ncbi:MAG: DM13 domain-containing protein [Bacteroidota bacterium]|nr:DM13 domain-containing protein [Bacteroidota bacterium]
MKKLLLFFATITSLGVVSCKKASTETLHQVILPADTAAMVKYNGSLTSGPSGSVSGQVKIYLKGNQYILSLENFSTTNGPDLKVYISKEMFPVNFIKLGDLQSTNGNQLYNISGTPDFTIYKYVQIYCEKYDHLFGYALLSE